MKSVDFDSKERCSHYYARGFVNDVEEIYLHRSNYTLTDDNEFLLYSETTGCTSLSTVNKIFKFEHFYRASSKALEISLA
jgi:hypothetical protein